METEKSCRLLLHPVGGPLVLCLLCVWLPQPHEQLTWENLGEYVSSIYLSLYTAPLPVTFTPKGLFYRKLSAGPVLLCLQLRMGPSSSPIHTSLVAEKTESIPSLIIATAQRKASSHCVSAASRSALFVSWSRGIYFELTWGGRNLKRAEGTNPACKLMYSSEFSRGTTICRKSRQLNFTASKFCLTNEEFIWGNEAKDQHADMQFIKKEMQAHDQPYHHPELWSWDYLIQSLICGVTSSSLAGNGVRHALRLWLWQHGGRAMWEDTTSPACCGISLLRGCSWGRSRRIQPEVRVEAVSQTTFCSVHSHIDPLSLPLFQSTRAFFPILLHSSTGLVVLLS